MKPQAQLKTVSVIIPVYNEKATVLDLIRRVEQQEFVTEIIVVDDGSTDGTNVLLESHTTAKNFKVISHNRNMGKTSALCTGMKNCSGDILVVQDADLEYDPKDIALLVEPIFSGKADVVFGSRFLGRSHRVLYFWHFLGNRFLTFLSNVVNNLNLTDMEVGYKAFRRQVIENMQFKSKNFGFEPEFTAKAARQKLRIYEVPINYYGRTYDEGKKATWKDGLSALWYILKFRFFD